MEANTKARATLPFTHRGYTTTFLFHKKTKESEDGKKLNDMEFFQLTHSSAKKGWVVEAEEKYDVANLLALSLV
ncbi:hypothetical protein Csa_018247 [Cucumis sativus]|nr:hypothetical protein Csa_018247 [Cucumis sativus]